MSELLRQRVLLAFSVNVDVAEGFSLGLLLARYEPEYAMALVTLLVEEMALSNPAAACAGLMQRLGPIAGVELPTYTSPDPSDRDRDGGMGSGKWMGEEAMLP